MNVPSPWHCPKCKAKLILREGRYGRFMACPNYPDCRYTKALWTYQVEHIKPHCNLCDDTGFLSFVKDDKIIPNARIYCECHDEPEHYTSIRPTEFDFPCSYTFRAYFAQVNEGIDLPSIEPPETQEVQEIYHEAPLPNKKLLELQGRVIHCENKILELRSISKRKVPKY